MAKNRKINVGVLASGNGSNLEAMIDACERNEIRAAVAVVICDNEAAFALKRAKKHGIDSHFVDRKSFRSKEDFEKQIVGLLRASKVDLVCLAGFMRIIGKTLLGAFKNRIMNIHPALLPSFPGLDAQRQAFDYGVKIAGCTVHFVDDEVDHGPIICQATVPVFEGDTAEMLRQRILENEHIIYPRAVDLFAEGRLRIDNRRVYILDKKG